MKNILLILGAIIIVAGFYYLMTTRSVEEPVIDSVVPTDEQNGEAADMPDSSVSGMRVEENAVVATEQRPGSIVRIAQVFLAAPGYVAIHEDVAGKPGAIIGSSALLAAGETNAVSVTLDRATRDGEKLWSMLHTEINNNTTFEADVDTAVESSFGGPLSGWFEIKTDAEENIEVTL